MELAPIWLTIEDAAQMIGRSRSSLLQIMQRGEIRSLKDGKRRLIPRAELIRYARAMELAQLGESVTEEPGPFVPQ
jgi:excisionase family DNA binding protein